MFVKCLKRSNLIHGDRNRHRKHREISLETMIRGFRLPPWCTW